MLANIYNFLVNRFIIRFCSTSGLADGFGQLVYVEAAGAGVHDILVDAALAIDLVEGGRGLVKEDDWRVLQEHPGGLDPGEVRDADEGIDRIHRSVKDNRVDLRDKRADQRKYQRDDHQKPVRLYEWFDFLKS